jgi:methionyl-tRNA formyltransferase
LEQGHEIAHVFTQPDRPTGRGRKLAPTCIGEFALRRDLPLTRTTDINAETLPPADLLIVIAFAQKIAPELAGHGRFGGVNLHASLLPKYRGAAPINWAILLGESHTGNSVIRLAAKMDAGAVLGQSQLAIDPLETAGELHDRLAIDGSHLMLRIVTELAGGAATESAQDEAAATQAPKLSREHGRIDFARPASEIARQIRGLHPWPSCRVRLLDAAGAERGHATFIRARPVPGEGPRWNPGEIMHNGALCAGDLAGVEILELQPEGKTPMSLADYRRGHPWLPGMSVQSI